ncbi:MAG: efflux RND transporter periplasmic adaptor subunit [Paracoccaceae bacterium]
MKTHHLWAFVALSIATPAASQEAISCIFEPSRSVTLSAPVPGILEEVAVSRGDQVEAGDLIARIDSTVERAALKAARFRAASRATIQSAETRLAEAQRQLAQIVSLAERGVASKSTLAELTAEVLLAESLLQEARDVQQGAQLDVRGAEAALEQRIVRAPVSGVILEQEPDVGEYAAQDTVLAELVVVDHLNAEVLMPSDTYRQVQETSVITVWDAGRETSVLGQLLAKDAVIDPASRTYGLSISVENGDGRFIPGTRCHIQFDQVSAEN